MRKNEWVGKRSSLRQNCQMRAEMRFLDGRKPQECIIVDISASGCRIELSSPDDVPEDFDLFIPSRSETKIAKVRRQDGVNLGVAFLKSRLDDPLVMQTLLERVLRLERGYNEIKSAPPRPEGAERRDGNDRRTAEEISVDAASGIGGPLVEHRLTALSDELRQMRSTLDAMANAPGVANFDSIAGRATEFAAELANLKTGMATLDHALRNLAEGPQADSVNHIAAVADHKTELTKLDPAVPAMTGGMPGTKGTATSRSGVEPTNQDTMTLARIKADIAQLRAALEIQQGGAARPVPLATMAEFVGLRSEIAELRQSLQAPSRHTEKSAGHDAGQQIEPGQTLSIKSEIAEIRELLNELVIRSGEEPGKPVLRARELAAEVATLKSDMSTLSESMRDIASKAYAAAPNFSADLAHMKADMLKLSVAMRDMSTEIQKVNVSVGPEAESLALARLDEEIAKLRAEMAARPARQSGPVNDDAASHEIDLLKVEISKLHAAMEELAAAPLDIGEYPVMTARELSADVAGLKSGLSQLTDAMRAMTAKAYDEAPAFSADLAHMKAEMLKLGIAMRETSSELSQVQAVVGSGADGAELAKINAEIERLSAAIETQSDRATTPQAIGAAREDFDELRKSVQTLILIVSQTFSKSREAA